MSIAEQEVKRMIAARDAHQQAMERQLKRMLRQFIRSTERQMQLIGRDFAKSLALSIDVESIVAQRIAEDRGEISNFSKDHPDQSFPSAQDRM